MESGDRKLAVSEARVTQLLELFYPVHYRACITLEDEMCRGQISRRQTAILWLIHSEGRHGRVMRRKDIERRLRAWFEVSSSAITMALRGMARPPLKLLEVVEDPGSGREKLVSLTPKGERFLEGMVARGREFMRRIVERLPENEVDGGIRYLRSATTIIDEMQTSRRKRNSTPLARTGGSARANGRPASS